MKSDTITALDTIDGLSVKSTELSADAPCDALTRSKRYIIECISCAKLTFDTQTIDAICHSFSDAIIEHVPMPLFFKDLNGIYRLCNREFADFFGLSSEEIIGKSVFHIMPEKLALEFQKINSKLLIDQRNVRYEVKLVNAKGEEREIIINKAVLKVSGETLGIVGTLTDITELKALERSQQQMFRFSQMLLRINQYVTEGDSIQSLLEKINQEIHLAFDSQECTCILINEKGLMHMATQIGYLEEVVKSFSLQLEDSYFWRYAKGDINQVCRINQVDLIEQEDFTRSVVTISGNEMISSLSAPIIIDGELYGLINLDAPIRDAFSNEQAEFMEYVRTQLAIAIKNMRLYEKTVYLSRYDRLTGLMNRHYFESNISQTIKTAKNEGKNLILLACDADYLKRINDELGHIVGDKVLVSIAKALQAVCEKDALVCRFGGDEFLAVLIGEEEERVNERLKIARNELLLTYHGPYPVSFSFGLASLSEDEDNYSALLRKADEAMYIEKRIRMKERRIRPQEE